MKKSLVPTCPEVELVTTRPSAVWTETYLLRSHDVDARGGLSVALILNTCRLTRLDVNYTGEAFRAESILAGGRRHQTAPPAFLHTTRSQTAVTIWRGLKCNGGRITREEPDR